MQGAAVDAIVEESEGNSLAVELEFNLFGITIAITTIMPYIALYGFYGCREFSGQ